MEGLTEKLFGTDGIRGKANRHPMTAAMVQRVAQAAGVVFRRGPHRHNIVIGKDTRLSGYLFESALEAGLISMGITVQWVGVLPTPAIAFLTRALRADAGVVISASHNPHEDNGIKFFGPNGMKLPDQVEREIERILAEDEIEPHLVAPSELGRAVRVEDARGRYIEFCKNALAREIRLDGLKVVMDCAHGAAYRVGPTVLWELGAEVVALGCDPNGLNINQGCGSLHPEAMAAMVRETGAHVGLALDGDADRLAVCDEKGQLLDGDRILAISAREMLDQEKLTGGGVVGTVMSNLGFQRYLGGLGLHLARTPVGDRHVLEHMLEKGYNLGGEQSGHLIFLDHNTTGDGTISALKVLEIMARRQKPLSELADLYQDMPQILVNVALPPGSDPLRSPRVQETMARVEKALGESGRLLVRKSGTEPKVRVMVEGENADRIREMAEEIADVIRRDAGDA